MEKQWVYIYLDPDNRHVVGTSSVISNILAPGKKTRKKICYLKFFTNTWDALAHKCLLEKLSSRSIKCLIDNEKQMTEALLENSKQHNTNQ